MKHLLLLCALTFFVSCSEQPKEIPCKEEGIHCMSNELLQCIKNYILGDRFQTKEDEPLNRERERSDCHFENGEFLEQSPDFCYELFFFNKDTTKYFTMRTGFVPIRGGFNTDRINMPIDTNILCYKILNRYVFIINGTGNSNNILFTVCDENIQLTKEKKEIKRSIGSYDGSFFPVSYKYYEKDNKITIEKLDTTLLYFDPGLTEFEAYHKRLRDTKEKEKREVYIMRNYFATNN